MQRLIYIIAALGIAGIVTWFVSGKLSGQSEKVVERPVEVVREVFKTEEVPSKRVLVAAKAIKPGQLVEQNSLEFQDWPQTLVRAEYKTDETTTIEEYLGSVPLVEIAAGEPILDGKLIKPGDKGFLAAVLRPGMKAVTFSVDRRSSVAGFVFPGDVIDLMISTQIEDRTRAIIASADAFGQNSGGGNNAGGNQKKIQLEFPKERVTETIIRDVKVLAVGTIMARPEPPYNNAETLTVELTPKLAEIVVNATQFATLNVALNPIRRTDEERKRIEAEGEIYPFLVSGVDTGTYSFTTEVETSPMRLLSSGGETVGKNFRTNNESYILGELDADKKEAGFQFGKFDSLGASQPNNTVSIFRAGTQTDVFISSVRRAYTEDATSSRQIGGVTVTPASNVPDPVLPPLFDSEAR